MKIGIISDSHDNISAMSKCLDMMKARGCEYMIHAGDVCSPFIARIIKESGIPHAAVFGNNDGEKVLLSKLLDIMPSPRHVFVGNLSIVIFHEPCINEYLDPTQVDLLIYGHTHQRNTSLNGKMLILNPGTLCGILADRKTFAIYDTSIRKAEIIEL